MNFRNNTIGFLSDSSFLIFGGPYSNLEALIALKKNAEKLGFMPHQIICTGDIVGYCADPENSVQFVKDWGIHAIAGNVELNLRDEEDDCGCNFNEGSRCDLFSKMWYPYAKSQLSDSSMKYLATLPDHLHFELGAYKGIVLHGSYENTSEFIFKSTSWEKKKRQFELSEKNLIISGHSGIPFYDVRQDLHWINAGVIGMPANDGEPHTWFTILSLKDKVISVNFHKLVYNHHKASSKMRSKPLPQTYAETLMTGIWDNCEILPETETKQQGLPLVLSV